MSLGYNDKDRRIIPRWRGFGTTASTGELKSLSKSQPRASLDLSEFHARRRDWEENRSLVFAGDFVSTALVLGMSSGVQDAAEFIIGAGDNAPLALNSLAKRSLGYASEDLDADQDVDSLSIGRRIHSLRHILNRDARNAIAWVDLSRAYAVIGLYDKAERAMRIAVWLQADNRFVLRSAARLFVHTDKPDEAHDILKRSSRTKVDPWLMAAEISVASVAGRTSLLTKEADKILERARFASPELGELASAMATLSMNGYNTKQARRMFKQSLQDPTENSVAQASWATASLSGIEITPELLERPYSFEAAAREASRAQRWKLAVKQCENWHLDEPYSSRPSQMGSYLALTALADTERAERIARWGLGANPNNLLLINNLTVALAEAGKLDEAEKRFEQLNRLSAHTSFDVTHRATEGLLQFRRGNAERGRQLYEEAIQEARTANDHALETRALAHLAREEMMARTEHVDASYGRALTAHKISRELPMESFLQRIQSQREAQSSSKSAEKV